MNEDIWEVPAVLDLYKEILENRTSQEVQIFLDCGAPLKIDGTGSLVFSLLAKGGHVNIIKKLLEKEDVDRDANLNEWEKCNRNGLAPLHEAVYSGHLDVVNLLLENGINPNQYTENGRYCFTPLHIAVNLDNLEIAKALLDYGADVSARTVRASLEDEREPIELAVDARNLEMVNLLHFYGAPLKQNLLYDLVNGGNLEITKFFLEKGASPNQIKNNRPLLHEAVWTDWPSDEAEKAINLLLAKGAVVSALDGNGNTALHATVYNRTAPGIAKILIDKGIDVLKRNEKGRTAFQEALRWVGVDRESDLLAEVIIAAKKPDGTYWYDAKAFKEEWKGTPLDLYFDLRSFISAEKKRRREEEKALAREQGGAEQGSWIISNLRHFGFFSRGSSSSEEKHFLPVELRREEIASLGLNRREVSQPRYPVVQKERGQLIL